MCIRYWKRVDDYIAGAVGGGLAILMAWAIGAGINRSFPTSYWYDLVSVAVEPQVRMGEVVTVTAIRNVRRDFRGRYVTTLRPVDGGRLPLCSGGSEVNYIATIATPGNPNPSLVTGTLDWWTAGAEPPCQGALRPGTFILTTCVFIDTSDVIFAWGGRQDCKDSNVFEVVE